MTKVAQIFEAPTLSQVTLKTPLNVYVAKVTAVPKPLSNSAQIRPILPNFENAADSIGATQSS
jgi:hypothetical protein